MKLAFRGDEDETDSNFKQIVNMKAEDDPALKKWLQKQTSHDMRQNEIIKIMGLYVLREIAADLLSSPFLTVIVDEPRKHKCCDPGVLAKESAKDPVIANVMPYCREGWPTKATSDDQAQDYSVEQFRKLSVSLSTLHECLLHGTGVVVPPSLQPQVLELLHLGHFGIQRMKQLARTAVYWPRIDTDITNQCHRCQTCAEHQTKPAKPANQPWMLPEKPWTESMWIMQLIFWEPTDTTDLLEQDFAHFGYPHTIVSDNATTFSSEEFQAWCRERGIIHLTGAPYHPATNGSVERLVQTFKQALVKSTLPPKTALQEFLMQYRQTPLAVEYSPSEDGKPEKLQAEEINDQKATVHHIFKVGTPCYALYCGPRRDKDPRWVPAVVTKVFGTRSVNVRVLPKGGTWRRHIEQLRPRYGAHEDADPGEPPTFSSSTLETANKPSEVDLDTAQSEEGAKAATPAKLQFPVRPYDLPKKLLVTLVFLMVQSMVLGIPGGQQDNASETYPFRAWEPQAGREVLCG
ncbi:hypothetical protein EMCRGX_G004106 [Ephydatia muelleri]